MVVEQAARAYLLWGDDALSRDDVVRSFQERMLARPGGELNLAEFHAPEIVASEVIAACDTLPFIDDRRLVVVHRLFSWRPRGSGRRSSERPEPPASLKATREALLGYLPRLAPRTTLLLVEGALSTTQRNEILKRLPRERAHVRGFTAPRGAELESWLANRAKLHGGALGPGVAALLRHHGPSSLEALDQELAKLIAYAGGEPVAVSDLRELLAGGEIGVFDLLDALAEERPADALRALRRLFQQGVRPEELAPQIIALYRRLLICRLALEERAQPSEVERTHGVKLIDKLRNQARRISVERGEAALERLLEFDRRLKRGEVEPEAGLEVLVGELAAASA
jgi:DNA polymerase-3 subunit delta